MANTNAATSSSMSADQLTAFNSAGGFTPSSSSTLIIGVALAITLLWGAWAISTGYKGWANGSLASGKFGALCGRFLLLYLILLFILVHK